MKGHLYFMLNDAMPGMVKIGHTFKSLEERVKQLNTTGVPMPFIIGACFYVREPDVCEKKLHELFEKRRVNNQREFFTFSLEQAIENSLPTIKQFLEDGTDSCDETSDSVNESKRIEAIVRENETVILLYLAQEPYAVSAMRIDSMCLKVGHLVVVNYLANLKKLGFVVERRSRKNSYNEWEITSEGVKYLFDSGELRERTDISPGYL